MAVLESLVLVLALTLVFRLLVGYLHFRRLELAIPGPPSLPVLGNLRYAFGLTPDNLVATFYRLWHGRYDELWRAGGLGRMTVIACNPDHLQELFTRRDFVNKDPFVYKFFNAIGGHGLVSLNGAVWRAHRRAFQPAFHQTLLDSFTPVFTAEALGFVRRVRPGEAQDVEDNLQSLAMRNFLRTSVSSVDLSEEEVEKIEPDSKALVTAVSRSYAHRMLQPWLWPDWVFFYLTTAGREIHRRTVKVDAFMKGIFAAQRDRLNQKSTLGSRSPPSAKYRTLFDVLMEPGDHLPLSDEEMLVEFKTISGAAVDTSVATLCWVLKVLSLRQDVQQQLLQEAEEVLSRDGASEITTADLDRLEYTERVLKETMRLLPTVPVIGREVRKETEFCGHTLPAGTVLGINVLCTHRHPGHWPDPLRFDPDRFLPENSVGRHPYAYLPFSAGPRNCIGSRYAMMSMKTLLVTLVLRYRIDPVDDGYKEPADLPMTSGIASRMPGGGVRVVFTPRTTYAA